MDKEGEVTLHARGHVVKEDPASDARLGCREREVMEIARRLFARLGAQRVIALDLEPLDRGKRFPERLFYLGERLWEHLLEKLGLMVQRQREVRTEICRGLVVAPPLLEVSLRRNSVARQCFER